MLISQSLDSLTTTQPTLDAKQNARYTLPLEPLIPEPCGQITIVSPFAPQLNTLVGLDSSDTSNSSPSFPSALYRLLKDGEVLHHILSKWIVRISPSILVKFAPDLDITVVCNSLSSSRTSRWPQQSSAQGLAMSCNSKPYGLSTCRK